VLGELLIFRRHDGERQIGRDSIQVDPSVAIDVVGVSVRPRRGLRLGHEGGERGLIQRSDATARTLAATPTTTSHTIARISRPTNDLFCATRALSGYSAHALHDDRVDRNIVEAAPPAGLDRGDLVDHVHAFGDAREHGVAELPRE